MVTLVYQDQDVQLYQGDNSELASVVQDVALIFTSPPYNVGRFYPEYNDKRPYAEYYAMLERFLEMSSQVLRDGGVLAVNIPYTTRDYTAPGQRTVPLSTDFINLLPKYGLLYRDQMVWAKRQFNHQVYGDAAVGTENNPLLAPVAEPVILASKKTLKMPLQHSTFGQRNMPICRNLLYADSDGAGAQHKSYPAPFPIELAQAIITLYSEEGDLICDPFCGSGTVLMAAKLLGRRGIGIDIDPGSIKIARSRISQQVLPDSIVPVEMALL